MKKSDARKTSLIIVSLISAATVSSIAQTIVPGGDVSGIWTAAHSPYQIIGEITIPNDSTLTIEPGVEVVFMGHYKLNVQGRLTAIGTELDTIFLTAQDTTAGWHGVRFNQTPNTNDTSRFVYCSFKYGKANTGTGLDRCGGAIMINRFGKVRVSHCLFKSNMNSGNISSTGGAAIYIEWASPVVTNSTFIHNVGTTECAIVSMYSDVVISKNVFSDNRGPHGPIFCLYSTPTISGNIICNNVTTRAGGGIFTMSSTARISNNIIIHNLCFGGEGEGGGIKCWTNDRPVIMNNTIAYNRATHGGGICCNTNSDPILINNIIWGNTADYGNQVNLLEASSDPDLFYCDIQGGREGFGGAGSDTNYSGRYENNIDSDPLFVNVTSDDLRLSDYSPCIGAGRDSVQVGGVWYQVPPLCFYGGPRPNPAGSQPDIGACENPRATATGVDDQSSILPPSFALEQNYPNPFNASTIIHYALPHSSFVSLSVYNTLGQQGAQLVNEQQQAGYHDIVFRGDGLASGVYFYLLDAGSFTSVKKLLLLK
jgi:hypothetical protein